MNLVDGAVLLFVAFSGLMGFARGLVREVLGLAAWIGAGAAAYWLFPRTQPLAQSAIANPDIAAPVAFGGVFLVALIALSLVARLLGGAVRQSALGGLDRSLGVVYGLGRGAAVIVAAYVFASAIEPVDHWPDAVLEARTLPSIYHAAAWATERLPEAYRPAMRPPPAGRATNSADLLHANPVGRALAAPPPRP